MKSNYLILIIILLSPLYSYGDSITVEENNTGVIVQGDNKGTISNITNIIKVDGNNGKSIKPKERINVNTVYYLRKYDSILDRHGSGNQTDWERLFSLEQKLLCNNQLEKFVEQRVLLSQDYGMEVGYEVNHHTQPKTTKGELKLIIRYLSTCLNKDEYYGTCVHIRNFDENTSINDKEVTYRIFGEFGGRNPNKCRT